MTFLSAAISANIIPWLYTRNDDFKYPVYAGIGVTSLSVMASVIYKLAEDTSEYRKNKTIDIANYCHTPGQKKKKRSYFAFRHIRHFKMEFWIEGLCFMFISMSYYQLTNFLTDLLINRYKYEFLEATRLFSLLPIVIMITVPMFSALVTFEGKKAHALLLCSSTGFVVYIVMQLLPVEKNIGLIFCLGATGLWFALYSSVIWTSFTLLVPAQGTAMALAIATTFQNILMTMLPMLFGKLNLERTPGAYNRSLTVLSGLSFCGILSSAALIREDNKSGGVLYLPENDQRVLSHKQSMSVIMDEILERPQAGEEEADDDKIELKDLKRSV